MNKPFDFINHWDIIVLIFGMLLKMFYALNNKVKELGKEDFSPKKYFDAKHIIRWTGHIVASFGFIMIAPQFILMFGDKFIPELGTKWPAVASFCVGFFGYDMIKLLEKLSNKIGIGPNK